MMTLNNNLLMRISGLMALAGTLGACSESPEVFSGDSAAGGVVRITPAPFAAGSGAEAVAGEDAIRELNAYLFEEGVLTRVYESLPVSGNSCDLRLERLSGRLYAVANVIPELTAALAPGLTEAEWLEATVGEADAPAVGFATGRLDLGSLPAGSASPVALTLTRGVARFDLRLRVAGEASVESFTLLDAARTGYLLPRDPVATPDGVVHGDLESPLPMPLTGDTSGVAYLYEQANAGLRVRIEAVVDGKSCTLEGHFHAGNCHIQTDTLSL